MDLGEGGNAEETTPPTGVIPTAGTGHIVSLQTGAGKRWREESLECGGLKSGGHGGRGSDGRIGKEIAGQQDGAALEGERGRHVSKTETHSNMRNKKKMLW